MWRELDFYRDLSGNRPEAPGLDLDLAEIAGHRFETTLARHTHTVGS